MQRWLVSMAVSSFTGGGLADRPLPFAPTLRDDLVAVARRLGYEVVPGFGRFGLSTAELGTLVGDLIRATAVEADQAEQAGAGEVPILVVHLLSHGQEHQGTVRVVGSDGRTDSRTSLDSWIADATSVTDPARDVPDQARGPWVGCGTSSMTSASRCSHCPTLPLRWHSGPEAS